MTVEIRTAAELIALDVEGRGAARRAARETELLQRVLRMFVDRPGPVPVEEIVAAFPAHAPESVREALGRLDDEDLLRIDAGCVNLAYPFSASATAFVVDLDEGRGQRFGSCAARSTRWGSGRCSDGACTSAHGATTAPRLWSCRSIHRGPDRTPRA
jgi:hypothetical protein